MVLAAVSCGQSGPSGTGTGGGPDAGTESPEAGTGGEGEGGAPDCHEIPYTWDDVCNACVQEKCCAELRRCVAEPNCAICITYIKPCPDHATYELSGAIISCYEDKCPCECGNHPCEDMP